MHSKVKQELLYPIFLGQTSNFTWAERMDVNRIGSWEDQRLNWALKVLVTLAFLWDITLALHIMLRYSVGILSVTQCLISQISTDSYTSKT